MEKINNEQYYKTFTKPIIFYGRLTNLLAIPLCFIPPLVLWAYYGVVPPIQDILKGWGLIASIFAIYAVIEPISYFPLVGLPGTYMVCLSGNIGNVRIPCSAIAQDALGTVPGSKKAELVSTLGIAGSILTNMLVITIAAIFGAMLMRIFPPAVKQALKYASPAIFGSIFGMNASKNMKYGLFAFAVAMILLIFTNLPTYVMIPLLVFGTIALALFLDSEKVAKS